MLKKAAAVSYSPDKGIPEIVAAARGSLVDRIIQLARQHNVTIYENPDLAEVLSLMKPGDQIPEKLFFVMAEILAYCYNCNESFREKLQKQK